MQARELGIRHTRHMPIGAEATVKVRDKHATTHRL
jgi:hypothetical protein